MFDRAAAMAAFDLVRPQIAAVMQALDLGQNLAIAIAGTGSLAPGKASGSFREDCLLVTAIGDRTTWRIDLEEIALAKARKSVRTGRATADLAPHLLIPGDTVAWGSVVLDDIVVACSGVKPWYDEMFATWLAAAIKAVCKERFAQLPAGTRTLPEEPG